MKKIKSYPSGLRYVLQKIKNTRVVAIGIYVGVGSAYETKEINGISHFIEHMLFKGTGKRTAFEIANDMESIGAQINAFTSRDVTAYYTISTDEHIEKCFEVLSDIFFNSLFSHDNMENEKGVVIEEINMCNDDPTDICHDQLNLAHFGNTGLGRPILGTIDNVQSFSPELLREYMGRYYCADNVVISVAGNIQAEVVKGFIDKYFEQSFDCSESQKYAETSKRIYHRQLKTTKPNEQVNIAIGFPSYKVGDRRIPSLYLLANILGGGMSSRLFQKLREENGLVYDVYATDNEYTKTGLFMIYLATKPQSAEKAVSAVKEVLDDIRANSITEAELSKGKEQLKSGIIFSAERAVSIMRSNGMHTLLTKKSFNLAKKIKEIDAISMQSVKNVIDDILDYSRASCSYVGKETDSTPYNCCETNGGKLMDQQHDMLQVIFGLQKAFDTEIVEKRNLGDITPEVWIQKEVLAMLSELSELLDEVNFKWWKNPKEVNYENVKGELIDILHFFASMCLKVGMDAPEVYERYIQKNKENFLRQYGKSAKTGYELDKLGR